MSKIRSMRGLRILKLMFRRIHLLRAARLRQVATPWQLSPAAKVGGANRDRTDDLMLAKHALSQLSYGPGLAGIQAKAGLPSRGREAAKAGGPGTS